MEHWIGIQCSANGMLQRQEWNKIEEVGESQIQHHYNDRDYVNGNQGPDL